MSSYSRPEPAVPHDPAASRRGRTVPGSAVPGSDPPPRPAPPAGTPAPVTDRLAEPPPAAATVFGAALPLARRYAELLVGPGVVRGLVGPHEADRIWERHLLNCAVVAELVPHGALVVDIGSGAGLPGIPLALARSDLRVVLVEPMARRVEFLHEAVEALGLGERVTVHRARGADHGRTHPRRYDVVTARAVAPLADLVTLAAPLLRPGGLLLALKGETVEAELAAVPHLDVQVHRAGVGVLDTPTTVAVIASLRGGRRDQRKERR